MKNLIVLLLLMFMGSATAQNKPAYILYNQKGKKVKYKKMMKDIAKADILLFGEQHNNPIAHWLQLEVTKQLMQERNVMLGAEMFETDEQLELNKYLGKQTNYAAFDSAVQLWPNFKTDYKPLVDLARNQGLSFVATNVPRIFASRVYKNGFEALNHIHDSSKVFMAPLPINYNPDLPGYKNIQQMAHGHGSKHLPKAQALKDATMAYFILSNYQSGQLFIHYNGTYHSENFEGITWYLNMDAPALDIITIATVSQGDINRLEEENKGLANYIICVDGDMTKTY